MDHDDPPFSTDYNLYPGFWYTLEAMGVNDVDGDGAEDDVDNCPNTPNGPNLGTCSPDSNIPAQCTTDSTCECQPTGNCSTDQEDSDGDGWGDVCDNCPNNCNYDQWDADVDGIGDVCDPDPGCGQCPPTQCETEC
jgi:hypothetical protein